MEQKFAEKCKKNGNNGKGELKNRCSRYQKIMEITIVKLRSAEG
jgi:hypothetical protein